MKIITIVLMVSMIPLRAFATDCSSTIAQGATESCNVIAQYGITWTLSANATVGQFVTGDYWVVGPVTVSSVSPAWTGANHGSMKNPAPFGGHAFTTSGYGYDAGLLVAYPVPLVAGDALVSSISDTAGLTDWSGGANGSNDWTEVMTILTVVASQPPSGSFRPCPSDRSQNLYNISQIDTSILPELSSSGITLTAPAGFGSYLAYLERGSERPWALFGTDYAARTIHPKQAMFDYHTEVGVFLSKLTAFLMLDVSGKDTLIQNFVQIAIDYYYSNNSDSSNWAMILPIAGLLINEPDFYNHWIDNPSRRDSRGHEKLYYPDEVTESTSSSIIPANQTWVDWQTPAGKYVAFRKQAGEEYEHLHPSEWTCYEPHCKAEGYRLDQDVHPMVGMMLAAIILDAQSSLDVNAMLAHPPYRDYIDRWMANVWKTEEYDSTGRTYEEEMDNYQTVTRYVNAEGSSSTTFINQMWTAYRGITQPPNGSTKIRYRFPGGAVITEAVDN